jgi:S-formylglutathione hydrolase
MLETISEHGCFGGIQGFYRHASVSIGLPMRFSVYQPPQAASGPVPVLFYLAGLTSTEETFMIKAGAQRFAAEHGIMLVAPDTSKLGFWCRRWLLPGR